MPIHSPQPHEAPGYRLDLVDLPQTFEVSPFVNQLISAYNSASPVELHLAAHSGNRALAQALGNEAVALNPHMLCELVARRIEPEIENFTKGQRRSYLCGIDIDTHSKIGASLIVRQIFKHGSFGKASTAIYQVQLLDRCFHFSEPRAVRMLNDLQADGRRHNARGIPVDSPVDLPTALSFRLGNDKNSHAVLTRPGAASLLVEATAVSGRLAVTKIRLMACHHFERSRLVLTIALDKTPHCLFEQFRIGTAEVRGAGYGTKTAPITGAEARIVRDFLAKAHALSGKGIDA